jgi:hypothetical protein
LVVSLDATSIPRRIQSSKSLIEQVEVEPSGSRSVVRIRLAKDGLRLKEMILASPPRIVLDVLDDPASLAKAKAASATPKPVAQVVAKPAEQKVVEAKAEARKAAPVREEQSFDDIVAQIPTEPKKAPAPAPAPAKVVEKQVAQASAKAVEKPVEKPKPVVAEPIVAKKEPVVADEPSTSTPIEESKQANLDRPKPERVMPTPEPAALPAAEPKVAEATPTPERRPMMVRSTPRTQKSGPDYLFWALVGGGAVVVLLGGVFAVRRMRGSGEVDFSEGDSEGGPTLFDDAPASRVATDDNPFGNLGDNDEQLTLGTARGAKRASLVDEEKESESVVFGDSEESKMEDMEVISRDQVNQSLGNAMPPMGGVPEEFQQMMREMNRRVEALEGRIDELVDARDRLERQVAAQTEELRVQRAAIARTQRAVRNLARPEDDEQEPTEPALRDPNQPTS